MKASFGLRCPTFPAAAGPGLLGEFAVRAEALGLDSFWLPDHLLPVGGYLTFLAAEPVLEPLQGLSYVAAITNRIMLGTGVLLAPFRHPLMLAKMAATAQYVSKERLILGLGTGWSPDEFRVLGIPRAERGQRTDEAIDILRLAFSGTPFDYHGKIFSFEGAKIEPVNDTPPPIWAAGGRGIEEFALVGSSTLAPSVAARIARLDGWLTRPTAVIEQIKTEYAEVRRLAAQQGRDPDSITLGHVNFCHLADGSRERALEQQRVWFRRVLGERLSFDRIRELHWAGTLDDVAASVERLLEAGVHHIVAHPLQPDPQQVDLWAVGVLARFGVKATPTTK